MLKILKKLEDPEKPLLGPNVKALKFWGLLLSENVYKKYLSLFMHFLTITFIVTEYVDVYFVKSDLNLLLNNLKVSMVATMGAIKVLIFVIRQETWKSIIDYVTRADIAQRATDDAEKLEFIDRFTAYCRKFTYWFWGLMYTTDVIVIFTPVFKYYLAPVYRENVKNGTEMYLQVVSSWFPIDNKNTMPGYLGACVFQTYAVIHGGGWITSFDTNAMVIMAFFRAELEMLRRDCGNIFGSTYSPVSDEVATERMKACVRRHVELKKYSELFNSCLSPIMFFYMFICSVNLCVTGFQMTSQTSAMERFLTSEFLVFGIAQLFIYCWHSNDVLYASLELSLGPYESTWWARSSFHRKNLFIMTAQFTSTIVFTAGPFTDLTVPTFINILKGAYSYYTLLSTSQIN